MSSFGLEFQQGSKCKCLLAGGGAPAPAKKKVADAAEPCPPPPAPPEAETAPLPPPPTPPPAAPSAAAPPTPRPPPPPPQAPLSSIPVAAIRHAQAIEAATVKLPPADPTTEITGTRSEQRVKMNRMRQRIAQRLKEAQNTNAMLTTFNEIDMRYVVNINLLKPNDIYICRTTALISRRYILNVYSTNIHTEYFKHAA